MVLEPVHQHSKGLPRRQLACGPPYLSFAFWIDSFVSSLSRPPLVLASSLLSHGVRGPLRPRRYVYCEHVAHPAFECSHGTLHASTALLSMGV
ncbi:hypothetical protein DAI22_06g139800 [Oryza sativa Japonica Group]|nr:hypothetical protein DAI22_06g139800 [Oryza sativa Japonica Group]KAF2926598.1 hypothetical protein DAI22_06g139800 [Oryza sativa Japonica Group]